MNGFNSFFFWGFTSSMGIFLSLISLILFIWVVYDSLVLQKEMNPIEKIFWIILSLIIPILIPLVYYYVIHRNEGRIFAENSDFLESDTRIDEIEKLHELKRKGAITEEEFEKKKKELLR